MPPQSKRTRSQNLSGKMYPRVILRPLMADSVVQDRSVITTLPAVSNLFNKPKLSDIKLHVGTDTFYAHKMVLCAGSEVFSKMLEEGNWAESKMNELVLKEEGACAKVFDRFLYFLYSGTISIRPSYVIPLFSLADKYDVSALYEECVNIIENGLKVYVVESVPTGTVAGTPRETGTCEGTSQLPPIVSSSGTSSESSSSEFGDSEDESSSPFSQDGGAAHSSGQSQPQSDRVHVMLASSPQRKSFTLVGCETFPLNLVTRMLHLWQNPRIICAALYNLEARVSNQIEQGNYNVWNTLDLETIIALLQDDHFCLDEFLIFRALKEWMVLQNPDVRDRVLSLIRFPVLTRQQLYSVDCDEMIKTCPRTMSLVQEAMRYQLFHRICTHQEARHWVGSQFEKRKPKGH